MCWVSGLTWSREEFKEGLWEKRGAYLGREEWKNKFTFVPPHNRNLFKTADVMLGGVEVTQPERRLEDYTI